MVSKRSTESRQRPSTTKPPSKSALSEPYTPTEAESQAARFMIEKRKKPPAHDSKSTPKATAI